MKKLTMPLILFAAFGESELKKLQGDLETGLADIKKQVDEKTSNTEALETKMNEMTKQIADLSKKGADAKTITKMQEHLDKLDLKMQKTNRIRQEAKSFAHQISDELTKNKDGLNALKSNRNEAVNLEIKAVGDLLFGDFSGEDPSRYSGHVYTSEVDRVLGKGGVCPNVLQQVVNRGTISGNRVVYVDMVSEGEAETTAEGAKKAQIAVSFEEKNADVRKITAFIKVSKEMLDDLDFLRGEINNELREAIEAKLEEQIYSGNGNNPNLSGITEFIDSTYTGAGSSYEGKVLNANTADALRVVVADIASDCFTPNLAVINPADAALLDLAKTNGGSYIMPPFASADGQNIAGIRVVTSSEIPVGDFVVGDFSKANLRIREAFNINVGYENDDFTKNMVTILAEMRAVFYIKEQHKKAFRRGSLDVVIDNIGQEEDIEEA